MKVTEKIIELRKQLQYVNNVLNGSGLAAWEAKEYAALERSLCNEINDLEAYIKHHNL